MPPKASKAKSKLSRAARLFRQGVDDQVKRSKELHDRTRKFVQENFDDIFLTEYAQTMRHVTENPHLKQECEFHVPCVPSTSVNGVYWQAVYDGLKEYLRAAGCKVTEQGVHNAGYRLFVTW